MPACYHVAAPPGYLRASRAGGFKVGRVLNVNEMRGRGVGDGLSVPPRTKLRFTMTNLKLTTHLSGFIREEGQ